MRKHFTKIICVATVVAHSFAFNNALAANTGVEKGTNTPAPAATVNNGANQSKSSNGMAQAMNYVTGAAEIVAGGAMIKAGTAPCPSVAGCNYGLIAAGAMLVMMGVTNIAQGGEHGNSAGSANTTGMQSNGFGGLNNPNGNNNDPYVKTALDDPNYKAVKPTLSQLEKMGMYDPKNNTMKIGDKTYKGSDFASPESMAAAGFPKGMIDGALAANAEAEKKAQAKMDKVKVGASTAENGYADGGGGSGGGGSGGPSDINGMGGANFAQAGAGSGKGSGVGRDPSAFQGMSKDFNGEPIGVAEDSIFGMMNRRYKLKETQDSFFSPSDLSLQN